MILKYPLLFIAIVVLFFTGACKKKKDFRNNIIGDYYIYEYKSYSGEYRDSVGQVHNIEPHEKIVGEGEIQVESYADSGIVIHGHMFPKVHIIDSTTLTFDNFPYTGCFYHNGDSLSWVWGSDDQINTPDSTIIFISYRGRKVK